MKRHILIFSLLAVLGVCRAVAGATMTVSEIYYNETYGYWGIDIGVDNGGVPVTAFQCDVAKPGTFGFAGDGTGGFLHAFTDRAMRPGGLGGGTVPTHAVSMALRPNGTLRVVVYSSDNAVLGGESGAVLFLAMNKPDGAEAGDTPAVVNLTNQALSYIEDGVVKSVYPDGIVNDPFLTCYDSMGDNVVLYAWGGYDTVTGIYTDIDFINRDIATNNRVVSVNMLYTGGYDMTKVTLAPLNPNALIYALSSGSFAGNTSNKLYLDSGAADGLSWRCDELLLSDDGNGLAFDFPYGAYAQGGSRADVGRFGFAREFPGGQWSTLILPVSLTDEQLAAVKTGGVEVARLDHYDAGNGTITYAEVTRFEANTPYLIRPSETKGVFSGGFENVRLYPTDTLNVVRAGGLAMHGNYRYTTISSTDSVWRYGYDASTGEFVKIGNNCRLGTFRCYLELPVSAQTAGAPNRIRIAGPTTTGIESVDAAAGASGPVYSVDGRRVSDDIRNLPAGVYVVNGRKVVVK